MELNLLFLRESECDIPHPMLQQILRISQHTENTWMHICRRDPMTQITMKSYADIHSHHNAVCNSTQTFNDGKLRWSHMWIKLQWYYAIQETQKQKEDELNNATSTNSYSTYHAWRWHKTIKWNSKVTKMLNYGMIEFLSFI